MTDNPSGNLYRTEKKLPQATEGAKPTGAKARVKSKAPRFSVNEDGAMRFSGEIAESFATSELELSAVLLDQVAGSLAFGSKNSLDARCLNVASQAMHSLHPKDGFEALVCSQMVATHAQGMEFMKRAAAAGQSNEAIDLYINRATRLFRTFATLSDALRGHRSSGGQKMRVEHVHVHKGGQAIVGPVSQRREGRGRVEEKDHE